MNSYEKESIKLYNADCLEKMKEFEDNSVDAVITDPPYGINFMNKKWDYEVPSVEIWKEVLRVLKHGGYLLSFASTRTQHRMACNIEDAGFEIRDMIAWIYGSGMPKHKSCLKPAIEPITLARKPANKATLLNIDDCKVEHRYPSNVIHDGSDEVLYLFPDSNGAGGSVPRVKITGYGDKNVGTGKSDYFGGDRIAFDSGKGSSARFFYCAKASKKDRGEDNNHPTVKPTELMKYLCRLVTPKDGIILDPFMGSGTTGVAAKEEGFKFIGIERDEEYFKICSNRLLAG